MIPFTPDERRAQFAPSQNVGGPVDPDILDIIGERPQPTMAQQVQYEVPEPRPIDPDVIDIVNQTQMPMMASLMGASQVNPDQAAEAKRLGSQIGIGQDIALRNLEDVRKRAFMADVQRRDIARANPVLAGFLSDPTFANEASDDIGALEQIGSFFADVGRAAAGQPLQYIPGELARGYMRGQLVAERGEIGTRAIMGEAEDTNFERAKQIQEEMRGLSGGGILASTAEVVAQNVAQAREVVGTGLIGGAAGSVIPGLGTMAGFAGGIGTGVVLTTGKIEAGNMYLDMKEQGINDDTAIPVALGAGLLNGVIEAVGMKIAAAPFRQVANRVMREQIAEAVRKPTMRAALAQAGKAYAMQVGTEATEEGLQELVNIAGEELANGMEGIDSETTMRDAAKRVLDSFVQGAMGSAILGGIGPGANLYVDLQRAGKATKQTQFFNDLSQNATASKLKARDAGAYERFVAATADGTGADTVFVDGATMRDVLSQAGVTDAQLEAIVPGLAQQVRQAAEQGNDVTIPTAQFAARLAGTKLGDGLLPHMRLSPDAMSATEAQQFEQNREALVEEARALLESKTEAESAFVQEADQVATTMRERLIAAGRDPALAEVESLVHQAFVVTQAARQGKTPAQFEAESGLREIVGAATSVVQPAQAAPAASAPAVSPRPNYSANAKLFGWNAQWGLATAAKQQGVNLANLTRAEYVQFAIDNGFRINDDQLRMATMLRTATSMSEYQSMRKSMRASASQTKQQADALFAMFAHQIKKDAAASKQLANGIRIRSGTASSDTWLYFKINSGANATGDTYKAYAGFSDPYTALTPDKLKQFMELLQARGFNGDLKSIQDLDQGSALSDQIVMHGATKADAELAQQLAQEFFGAELSFSETGMDSSRQSYSQILAAKIDADISSRMTQPVSVSQAASAANIMEQPARAQYPALAKAWNRYNTGEEIQTPQDLADSMESLVEDGRAPESIAEAVRQYREAQAFDVETKGRGELDAAGNALEIAVQQAAEQMRPTPSVMEQASRIDADYMAAVKRGDTEAAQRMVDEAAKAAGFTVKAFHGSASKPFWVFDPTRRGERTGSNSALLGFFASSERQVATEYQLTEQERRTFNQPTQLGYGLEAAENEQQRAYDIETSAIQDAEQGGWLAQITKTDRFGQPYTYDDGFVYDTEAEASDAADAERASEIAKATERVEKELARFQNEERELRAGRTLHDLWVRLDNPLVYDFRGGDYRDKSYSELVQEAIDNGHDGVIMKNTIDSIDSRTPSDVIVFFNSNQAKLADPITRDEAGNIVPLSRRFDITSPRIFEQAAVPAAFYSALGRAIDGIDIKSASASGWKERIKGLVNKGEIKQDELTWSGLEDWLSLPREGKITKDEVAEFLKNNGVRVEQIAPRQPKYAQYTLPGGTNYREVLLTLPVDTEQRRAAQETYNRLVSEGVPLMEAMERAQKTLPKEFRSQHWTQPNVVAHIRMNDRVDADGKRVLFVEEIQSDWAQAGRKKGFRPTDARRMELIRAMIATNTALEQSVPGTPEHNAAQARMLELEKLTDEFNAQYLASTIPIAPFIARQQFAVFKDGKEVTRKNKEGKEVKQRYTSMKAAEAAAAKVGGEARDIGMQADTEGWVNLALKQIMLEAVNGGYDRVAFINGEQSKDRYDLGKEVDRIVVAPRDDGKSVNIELKAGYILSYGVDADGVITATTEESGRIAKVGTPLADVIGKEMAEKVMQTERGTFAGEDLKVGGEGMVAFYDKIVPAATSKLLEKLDGGKLGEIRLPYMLPKQMEADADRLGMTQADILEVAGEEDAYSQNQAGFDVTDALRDKVTSGLPLFQAMPGRGPARGGYDPSRLKILFGKGADFTTGAHELTHYYVDYYTKQALAGTAAPQMLADLDIMFKFMGVAGATPEERLAAFNAMPFETSRPLIETITYNAEIYLFEGKAPSLELAGVFDRMLAFFRRAYKSIADFVTQQREIYRAEFGRELPELSDELRQVFDRMLADERQIKQAQAVAQMRGQFTVKPEGMDDAEWAAYQEMAGEATNAAIADMTKSSLRQMEWLSRARSRIIKDMQARHTAQRKEVRERVQREVQQDPLYRAMAFLRRGQVVAPDGTVTEAEGVHRIDRVLAAEVAPTVDLARLGGRFGVLQDDGLHPDIVAEMFGLPAGASLLQALADAKPMREVVEDRTDAEMLRLYGEMNTPEAREQEIQKALHNEARARLVGVELRFMGKVQQPVRVLLEAARQAAKQVIDRKIVRDIRPSEFVAAEAKAAREALTGGEFSDPSTVAQTASTRAYKKAMEDGLTEADAADRAMQAGLKAAETQRAKIAEFESRYAGLNREQIIVRAKRAQLLNNQLAKAALEARDEIDNGVRYLRRVLRDSNRQRMGADVADQIASLLDRFNIAPMTADEARRVGTLAEFLSTLEDRGLVPDIAEAIGMRDTRIPYKNMTIAEFRDLVDAVKQLEYIGKNERKILLAKEKAEFESVRDEIVASVIDNAGDRKANARTATTNIGRAVTAMKGFAAAHLKAASIVRILDGGKDGGPLWNYLIRSANEAGDSETSMRAEATADLTKILEPVFRAGKLGGKGVFFPTIDRAMNREARLVVALNMGNAGNMQRLLDGEGWSIESVMPVLQSLTEDELNTVQQIWDYFEKYRPMIGQKERRLYGKEPAWVDPQPLVVRSADGKTITLRGGYYPIKYDPKASMRAETMSEAEEAKRDLAGAYTTATTRRSFTKARVRKVEGRPLLYTLAGMYGGINDVIHDLTWHEWLITANRLMRSNSFDDAVRNRYGPEYVAQLKNWIKDVAAGERGVQNEAEMALNFLRQGISSAGLGFNIVSAAMQITGFNQSIVRLGAGNIRAGVKWMGRGIAYTVANPMLAMQEVNEKSEFMRNRSRTQFRELNEIRNMVQGQSIAMRRVQMGTYFLMMRMQRMVDVPTWHGAYEKAMHEGRDEETAIALADQAVIDSQGGGMVKDLARVERGGPAVKLFTVFYGYMNTVYNMAAVQTMTNKNKGRLAADYAMLFVVPVVLSYMLKQALIPRKGDEEEEWDMGKIGRELAAEQLSYLMGTMVIAREFGEVGKMIFRVEGPRMGYGGPAGLRAIGETYQFATQASQGEFDTAFRKSAVNMIGAFTGLPSAQVNRTLDGLEALYEGETQNVLAPLTGAKKR